jgi:hypothetical protein
MSVLPTFLGFNGIQYPKIDVLIQPGGTIAQGPTTWVLGHTPGLDTATLGGAEWSNISDDVIGFSRQIGRAKTVDNAQVGIGSISLDNESGNYDSSNPNGLYWSANVLDSQQSSFEANNTNGWLAEGNTSIASSTTVGGYTGLRALQLNKIISTGNVKAETLTGTSGVLISPNTAIRASAYWKAQTVGRPCKVRILFYDEFGASISGTIAGSTITDTTTGWTQAVAQGVSPALATYAAVEVEGATDLSAPVGENHYVDLVTLQTSGIDVGLPVQITSTFAGITYGRFEGTVRNVKMDLGLEPYATLELEDGLGSFGRIRLPNSPTAGDLDYTGQRIGRIADAAAWPTSKRVLDTGYTRLGGTTLGAAALELLRKVEMTEFGLLFVNQDFNLTFFDRHQTTTATRSLTVQADLTDVEMTTLEAERNVEESWNQVSITRSSTGEGDEPVEQVANDLTAQSRYGVLEFPGTVGELLVQDEDVLAMAQGLIPRGRVPKLGINEIRIDAITLDQWPTLLALTLLDRIKINRNYGPNTINPELLIQSLREEVTVNPPRWALTFTTSVPHAAPSLFVLDTAQVGVNRLGW